jgi:D-glycero-D-manno-heptose 1,7-bisphosphate phosphatase
LSVEELVVVPDAPGACAALRAGGYLLVVVTNQPEVARGRLLLAELDRMHDVLSAAVPLDRFEVCPHDETDGCGCRKPKPGMILRAAEVLNIDLPQSVVVGDRWRDIAAGRAANCRTVFVDRGYDEQRPEDADLTVSSLGEAVGRLLAPRRQHSSRPPHPAQPGGFVRG